VRVETMKRTFVWDGEKIKETVEQVENKLSTKDILNGLDHVRSEIYKMENQEIQLKQQIAANKNSIGQAKEFEKDLRAFEEKCEKLQKEKILYIIETIHKTCLEKATKSAAKAIEDSPEAYTESAKKNLPFLDYQKLLATDKKMAEKICNRMIRTHLYEKPIFDNPFKG